MRRHDRKTDEHGPGHATKNLYPFFLPIRLQIFRTLSGTIPGQIFRKKKHTRNSYVVDSMAYDKEMKLL